MTFDVEAERFDVNYDADRTTPDDIAAVVRELGYEPTTVSSTHGEVAQRDRVSLADLPQEFRTLFEEAHRADKPVLLDFTAPG